MYNSRVTSPFLSVLSPWSGHCHWSSESLTLLSRERWKRSSPIERSVRQIFELTIRNCAQEVSHSLFTLDLEQTWDHFFFLTCKDVLSVIETYLFATHFESISLCLSFRDKVRNAPRLAAPPTLNISRVLSLILSFPRWLLLRFTFGKE